MSFLLGSRRRKLFLAAGTVAGMIVAAAAVAYFTGANGSGTGSAAVGTSSAWSVSVTGTPTFTPSGYTAIYPGAGVEAVPFTITNTGKGYENLKTLSYAIKNDGGTPALVETATGTTGIVGCQASWFTATGDPSNPSLSLPANSDIAPGASYQGSVDVAMSDSGSNQDGCQSALPGVTVTGSSS